VSFPATPLPALTELLIDGAWTAATVREESGVAITRGRANESGRVAASHLEATLDDRSGAYSNRLPTSVNYGKLGRNTQLRHRLRWVQDTFTRSVSSNWGTADSLQAWSIVTGTAADFSSSGATGQIALPTANVDHIIKLPVGHADMTVYASGVGTTTGTVPVGNDVFWALCGRYQGTNDLIAAELTYHTSDAVELKIYEKVGGVFTQFAAVTLTGLGSVTAWDVELRIRGNQVAARAWVTGTAQPAWMLTGTTTLTGTGDIAVSSKRFTGNTTAITYLVSSIEVSDFRFWGEVPAWPQTWDVTGTDVTAPIEAAGIMRRLGTRAKPLRSALTRAMAGISEGDFVPIAHWPMDGGSGATSFASGFSGQPAATITGSVSPASYSGFMGSDPLPVLNSGGVVTTVFPTYTDTGGWQVQFTFMIPSSGFSNDADMVIIPLKPGGTVATLILTWDQGFQDLRFTALNAAGASLGTNFGVGFGGLRQFNVGYMGAISDYTYLGTHYNTFSMYPADDTGIPVLNLDLTPGGTPGVPMLAQGVASSVSSGWSYGQVALYTDTGFIATPNIGPNAAAAGGYIGETATDRMIRLCREEGIYLEVTGDTADSAPMGPQTSSKLLDLMFDCADTDLGILYEPRDALGLAYRTRPSLYNQTGLGLDYAASQVFAPFAPTEDDQLIVNDATARRPNGSWARVTAEPGPLSTDDPPDGVGTYDEDRTYNVYTDDQLLPIAGWRVHLGSWDEARYPQVHVMLHAPGFSANAMLTAQAAAVDIGDYLSVDNPPANLPPDLIELLAQGYRETHHTYEWDITWNCVPAGPYKVFTLDSSVLGRLSGDQALASSVTTSATSWSVATLSGPLLATSGPFGQQWMVEGELVTVTNVTGGTSPQTATVTRNVNGIPGGKTHGSGAACNLFPAPYLAL
jgi:hypothetical protein